ncbi:MAG: two-CW domain-containing protein [Thermoplasmatota archaeon]
MMGENCWEIKRCGREPGGERASDLGICPASRNSELDCMNSGECAGRACWRIKEPIMGGTLLPHWSDPDRDCLVCPVLVKVRNEEPDFQL